MFGLSATLAPKLNGIQIGFPYIMQFIMERNAQRLKEATQSGSMPAFKDAAPAPAASPAAATPTPAEPPKADADAAASTTGEEALLN
jgi:hypothetical protein